MKTHFRKALILLTVAVLAANLAGCGLFSRSKSEPAATPEPSPTPAVEVQTPTPEPTPTPTPEPTPAPTPTPTPAPTPTLAPTPTPAPTPTDPNFPRVTKNPTSETVPVGGTCQFVTKYEKATWAEWHFVSPDGTRDLNYIDAGKEFPNLKIINGYAKDMTLQNVPEALNGWKVYCHYSNDYGAVNTESATITVTGGQGSTDGTAAAGTPRVTKNPTGETVKAGESAWFVAKYENATWAVWHFVSPDNTCDLSYTEAAKEFPTLTIKGGDQSTMQLQNIPAELNGWKVYCAFRNDIGTTNTTSAQITVTGGNAQPTTTPTPTPTPSANPQSTDSDRDYYSGVTAMDKETVEDVVAFNARRYYLGENWYELADMIWYPITINGQLLNNADDFLGFMMDKTISDSDRQELNNEDCHDMFFNGQGICMGAGEIWLNDPNYMTDRTPTLKIIALNGIVNK